MPDQSAVEDLEMLLATGRVKDALEHAVQAGLWGHAFMLGSLMGHKYLGTVQTKYVVVDVCCLGRTLSSWLSLSLLARLSQALLTTTPTNFYHPNHSSTKRVVESFNSWSTQCQVSVVCRMGAGLTLLLKYQTTVLWHLLNSKQLFLGKLIINFCWRNRNSICGECCWFYCFNYFINVLKSLLYIFIEINVWILKHNHNKFRQVIN